MSTYDSPNKALNQALTQKELMFVERYFTHWNVARAAREAGYCENNPDNSKLAGFEIIRKPYIKAAIDERMQSVCMEANEVLGRLADMARGDIMDFLSKNDRGQYVIDIDKAKAAGKTHLIKSYSTSRLGDPQIELYNAADALDKIAKHLNLFKGSNDPDVSMSLSAWALFVKSAREAHDSSPSKPAASDFVDATFVNPTTGPSAETSQQAFPPSVSTPATRPSSDSVSTDSFIDSSFIDLDPVTPVWAPDEDSGPADANTPAGQPADSGDIDE